MSRTTDRSVQLMAERAEPDVFTALASSGLRLLYHARWEERNLRLRGRALMGANLQFVLV